MSRTALLASAVLGLSLLAGCATIEPADNDAQAAAESGFRQADRAARIMVGRYIGLPVVEADAENQNTDRDSELVLLEVSVDPASTPGQAVVRIRQRAAMEASASARQFLLSFRPTGAEAENVLAANRLQGGFAPLNAAGQVVRSCPLEIIVQPDGFVAQTRAADCRFAGGNGEVTLIKEIAHDGQRLVIGDRLLDAGSGEPVAPDQIIQFDRIQIFSGWAGVREDASSDWRLASDFRIESTGIDSVPTDAGGMDLGVSVEIAPYRWRADEPSVLRLRAFDLETGQLVGQSWANWNASQIGLALPNLQIGLTLDGSFE